MANVSITMSVPAAGVSPALTGSGESVGSGSGSTVRREAVLTVSNS